MMLLETESRQDHTHVQISNVPVEFRSMLDLIGIVELFGTVVVSHWRERRLVYKTKWNCQSTSVIITIRGSLGSSLNEAPAWRRSKTTWMSNQIEISNSCFPVWVPSQHSVCIPSLVWPSLPGGHHPLTFLSSLLSSGLGLFVPKSPCLEGLSSPAAY